MTFSSISIHSNFYYKNGPLIDEQHLFFFDRIAVNWNKLSKKVINESLINAFKKHSLRS